MQRITTNLWFDGNAVEAAEHYISIFPSSKIVSQANYPEGHPAGSGVMVVEFVLDGQRVIGINGGPMFTFSEAISLQVNCADQAEVDYYWERLGAGGEEGPCGWLKDKFGLSWQVTPVGMDELFADPDPQKAARAFEAMMGMKKLDVATLEAAAEGVPAG